MLSRSIPIRFEFAAVDEIDHWASVIGISRSGLIKLAVVLQLRAIKSGRIDLNLSKEAAALRLHSISDSDDHSVRANRKGARH